MTVLSNADLSLLREQPHYAQLFLSIYHPKTILSARVNNPNSARGDRTIHYNNSVSSGTVVAGMTLLVGTSAGGCDMGRLRVRSDSGTALVVSTNNVYWIDTAYLTVVNYFEPWTIWPNVVADAQGNNTFYKDYDIVYDHQNEYYDPIPMMGPNRADNTSSGVAASLYFDGSESYCLNDKVGGTNDKNITSYLWEFEGGAPSSSTGVTPGYVDWVVPGHYVVSLKVTTGTHSQTGYRHVSIYDINTPSALPPTVDWGITNLTGDYSSGGWTGKIWMRQTADLEAVPLNALVVIYSNMKYGGTTKAIGGNYLNCENILFSGYILNDTLEKDPITNIVTFDVTNMAGRLAVSEALGVNTESCPNPTNTHAWKANNAYKLDQYVRPTSPNGYAYYALVDATSGGSQPSWPTAVGSQVDDGTNHLGWRIARDWFHLREATVDRHIYHYLRWHSTVYLVADVNPTGNSPVGSTIPTQYGDFGRQPLFKALDDFLQGTLRAHVVVDRQGQVFMEPKTDILNVAVRAPGTTMILGTQDWRDKLSFTQRRVHPISYVEISGWMYAGPSKDVGVGTAVTSCAPSTWPNYEGTPDTVATGLVFVDKPFSQSLSGNLFADLNKEYPQITIPMAGAYTCFDIGPQERLIVNLDPSQNYLGLQWIDKKFITRSVNMVYTAESRALLVDVTVEEESDGPPGIDGPYPAEVPAGTVDNGQVIDVPPPPTAPTLPPGNTQPVDAGLVYVATRERFGRSRNFTADFPTYADVTGVITGLILDFELNPHNPKSSACVVGTQGIWITNSLDQTPPAWINAQSPAQFGVATGDLLEYYQAVRYTQALPNLIYVSALGYDGADYHIWVGHTLDGGINWIWVQVGVTTTNFDIHGFASDYRNAGNVLVSCGAGKLWLSTTFGNTWSNVFTLTSVFAIANIDRPYADSSSNTILIGGDGGTTTHEWHFDAGTEGWTPTFGGGWVPTPYHTASGSLQSSIIIIGEGQRLSDISITGLSYVVPIGGQFTFWALIPNPPGPVDGLDMSVTFTFSPFSQQNTVVAVNPIPYNTWFYVVVNLDPLNVGKTLSSIGIELNNNSNIPSSSMYFDDIVLNF